jgi:hypothetical protein
MSWGQIIGGIATLVFTGIAVAAIIAILTYDKILEWFQQKRHLLETDSSRIGISILEHLNNGNYRTVQGIFDTETEEFIDGRSIESRRVDSQIVDIHRENGYVIYTLEG